jgi:6-phosphogluconate dehydrogenase
MNEVLADIGMIGLGVMGRNLVLNLADKGFTVAAFNRTTSVTQEFVSQLEPGQHVLPAESLEELLDRLSPPRRIMLMVAAGKAVDAVLDGLKPLLRSGDIVIDGGNSHYVDTDRRAAALEAGGVRFLGVGISGGESGARHGPSIMPGGPVEAYEAVRPLFESAAAVADGRACVTYLGPGSAGHYVKMVHNGIEYGLMQLISESYALLKHVVGIDNDGLADIYAEWQSAELDSYLVDITAQIFRRRDEKTGDFLVDRVLGEAAQLGTGMWSSQSAMDLHVPAPNIDAAVSMRNLSGLEEEREATRRILGPATETSHTAPSIFVDDVRAALYAGMIVTYAQGFAQLQRASEVFGYGLPLHEVASIWRGGCIIRSALLGQIRTAFERQPGLTNLQLDQDLGSAVAVRRGDVAASAVAAMAARIPVPGLSAALAYADGYAAGWLPTNLIQAQRDFFGAHTYRRIDEEGIFHTDWAQSSG